MIQMREVECTVKEGECGYFIKKSQFRFFAARGSYLPECSYKQGWSKWTDVLVVKQEDLENEPS